MTNESAAVQGRFAGRGSKPVVVAIMGHYVPGWKGGGHIITGAAAVEQLGGDFDFRVFCLDHDLSETAPYPGVEPGVWRTVGNAQVCYLPDGRLNRWWREAAARGLEYDLLWIHGLFKTATITTLVRRRAGSLLPVPAVIVPHGELSPGALGIKPLKKAAYLRLAKLAGLYEGFWWQATTPQEAGEVTRVFPRVPTDRIRVVRNLASRTAPASPAPRPKEPGTLRLVFLSRISRVKNLDAALRFLSDVEGNVAFDVFGPMEDASYWAECQSLIDRLPPGVRVTYRGPLEPASVIPALSAYHALLLPTRSENFGHVILEALQAGCLPVISDATPWRGLERASAGWDLPLAEPPRFTAALQRLVAMDAADFAAGSAAAARLGRAAASDPEPAGRLRELFMAALGRGGDAPAGAYAREQGAWPNP